MHRVFLADDEKYILEGLRLGIPWAGQGFTVCGTAGDGQSALEGIERLRPDVVFTDVRMPCLSGLDLIARVRQRLPGTLLVVISGHADFEYARSAIEHRVDGYILKPIEGDEIVAHLRKFRGILDRRLAEGRSGVLMNAIEQDDRDGFHASLPGGAAQCILSNGGRLPAIETRGSVAWCKLARSQWLYVTSQPYAARTLAALADRAVLGLGAVACTGGGSPSACVAGATILSYGYFMDPAARIRTQPYDREAMKRYLLLLGCLSRQAMKKDHSAAEETLESLGALLGAVSIAELSRSWSMLDALTSLAVGEEESGTSGGFHALVRRWPDAAACFADFEKGIRDVILPPPDHTPVCTDNRLVAEAISYLREHTREGPTLPELARRFHVGQEHLSRLFKKETGLVFSKYLTSLRLERSCELLSRTDLSVNDVAQESGYEDYLYFRRVFKRHHGVTPTEYRGQRGRAERPSADGSSIHAG